MDSHERALLDDNHHHLRGLVKKETNFVQQAIIHALPPCVLFVTALGAFAFPWYGPYMLCGLLTIILLVLCALDLRSKWEIGKRLCEQHMPESHEHLSHFVRSITKSDEGWKQQWDWYCSAFGDGNKDPGAYDLKFVQKFVARVQGGYLPNGGLFQDSAHTSTLEAPYERRSVLVHVVWWPFWRFAQCLLAVFCAFLLGRYLWKYQYQPYIELSELQTYSGVDPSRVSGERIQDAGVVEFAPGVAFDRTAGGCFVHEHTYCVAPILKGGKVGQGLEDATKSGSHDFFAVGIDCCSCPNQDFRCGQWNNPLADGGLRSMDVDSRPLFRLAVEDWAAQYSKTSEHPVFFEWVQRPRHAHNSLFSRGMNLTVLSITGCFPAFLILAFLLTTALELLVAHDIIATPQKAKAKLHGYSVIWKHAVHKEPERAPAAPASAPAGAAAPGRGEQQSTRPGPGNYGSLDEALHAAPPVAA